MSAVLRCLLVGAVVCGAVRGAPHLSLDDERRASLELEMLEWDLEAEDDGCDNLQTALWTFLTRTGEQVAQERVSNPIYFFKAALFFKFLGVRVVVLKKGRT